MLETVISDQHRPPSCRLADLLDGSPYSLPDDGDVQGRLNQLASTQHDLSRRLTTVIGKLKASRLFLEQQRSIRTREIFESNAIEGVGPDLPETYSILTSQLAGDAVAAVKVGMLLTSLTSERKVLDVIGLNTAREISKKMVDQASTRPISQADIRTLHSLVQTGDYAAGAYRSMAVGIEGSTHCPPDYTEVPRLMAELVDWIHTKQDDMPAVLHAAVVHGWLTHIHPFSDGNGRTARIVVNMLMAQLGLPPVIVRHGADRATYLDALSLSDHAGDILPFTGVLMRAQKRLMRQMEKPAFLRQVFYDEVKRRGGSMFEFWSRILSEFVQLLIGSLGLYRLRVEQVGEVDRTSYELLRDGDSTGNMWLLRIFDQGEAELLVWLGYSSWRTAHAIHDSNREPALYFSVRSPKERMEPYRRTYEHELGGLREIVLIPGMPSRVYAAFSSLKVGGLEDSADFIAEQIGRSFSKGEILSNPA